MTDRPPIRSHGSIYGASEQPPEIRRLMEAAMDAEEMFDLDELERFAAEQRRKEESWTSQP